MNPTQHDVVIVGAGLAGLAAASALSGAGAKVLLLERKPLVGGRAYSYQHPSLNEEVDCQHVLLGCCTNLRALCADAGITNLIRWYKGFTFLEPQPARPTYLRAGSLPAPLHASIDFLRAPMLSLQDKVAVARGLMEFAHGYPSSDAESFTSWAVRTRQTERAIRHLWQPIVVSALNDSFDNCSTKYAGQVLYESFLKSAEGGWFGIPTQPLSTFYAHVAEQCVRQGSELRLHQPVTGLNFDEEAGTWTVQTSEGDFCARQVILAVPFQGAAELLPSDACGLEYRNRFAQFQNAPITTVHLWFDREVTDVDHAVLLDTGIQWLFHKSRIRGWPKARGSYIELTISDSSLQLRQSRDEILSTALHELGLFFPALRESKLLKSGILKDARATFSVKPGLDAHRPPQATPWEGLFVAGDWTATGWPSTMEGAVRSGYLAAEALTQQNGSAKRFLQPDLPPAGLMKLLTR